MHREQAETGENHLDQIEPVGTCGLPIFFIYASAAR